MANFCTNCGTRIGKDDNFCTSCGAKVDKSDIRHNEHSLKSAQDIEKEKAKKELKRVVGRTFLHNKTFGDALIENGLDITNTGKAIKQQVEKEIDSGQIKSGGVEYRVNQLILEYKIKKEEENKRLKTIDEIFESEEIKSEIMKSEIDQTHVISIRDIVKNRIIDKREDMGEEDIKDFIKTELKKAAKEREKAKIIKERKVKRRKTENNKTAHGGYCRWGCRYYCEEILDSGGAIVADYVEDMSGTEYYCSLGHDLVDGRFCEDYE